MPEVHEYEGQDRRVNPYNNFDHPLLLRPHVLLSMISAVFTIAVVGTVWFTAEMNAIDDRSLKNEQSIESMQKYQAEQNGNLKEAIDDLKQTNQRQFESLDRKVDKLIDRQLKK